MQCPLHVDVADAKTFLIKLAIILEEMKLHPTFFECDGLTLLAEYLTSSLLISVGDANPSYSIMSSIVKCILYTSHSNPAIWKQSACIFNFLLSLLRYLNHNIDSNWHL